MSTAAKARRKLSLWVTRESVALQLHHYSNATNSRMRAPAHQAMVLNNTGKE